MDVHEIPAAVIKVLSAPLVFVDAIRAAVTLEWGKVVPAILNGQAVTVDQTMPLLKWLALGLVTLIIVILVVVESFQHIVLTGIRRKRWPAIISDLLLLGLALVFYYVIAACALYSFFNILLPRL